MILVWKEKKMKKEARKEWTSECSNEKKSQKAKEMRHPS
jgi:hypothetical protein